MDYTPGAVGWRVPPGTTSLGDPLRMRAVCDEDAVEAAKRYHLALTWKPPAGHATWCPMQVPPVWRHRSAGDTPMSAKQCGCGKSRVARSLRKLREREAVESCIFCDGRPHDKRTAHFARSA